jgi:hypothetical protein
MTLQEKIRNTEDMLNYYVSEWNRAYDALLNPIADASFYVKKMKDMEEEARKCRRELERLKEHREF